MVGFVMRTKHDIIQRKTAPQQIVHTIQFAARLISAREPRLIGGGNQDESNGFKLLERFSGGSDDFEFFQADGSDLLLGTGAHLVQNRIALDEYRSLHGCPKA